MKYKVKFTGQFKKDLKLLKKQGKDEHDSHGAEQTQLLRDGSENEIRMHLRNQIGMAMREACAPDAARAERKKRLHDLVSAARGISPRIEPDIEAHAHMRKEEITEYGSTRKKGKSKNYIRLSPCSHIRHGDSYAEKEQG